MTYEELGKLKAEGKLIQGKQREEGSPDKPGGLSI